MLVCSFTRTSTDEETHPPDDDDDDYKNDIERKDEIESDAASNTIPTVI